MSSPYISIAIPIHNSPKTAFFLSRLLKSLDEQTFKDYEIVITKEGEMAHNHNAAILKSKGVLVKMMQMDDYFAHPDALAEIVKVFSIQDTWMISASTHSLTENGVEKIGNPHIPSWNDEIYTGNNTLGSISTLTFRNSTRLLFEEPLTWAVDCDLYYRYYIKYGKPKINNDISVVIDVRNDRLSSTLGNELKHDEVTYLLKKYGK